MTPRENHEEWRQKIKALFHGQRPAGLNDQLGAVKKGMCQGVVRHDRPGTKIVLQTNSNAQQQKIHRVNARKPVHEIFYQPLASQLSLLIVDPDNEKAAQRKEERHDVDGDMRVDPRREMVEKNDGGSESPDACQGGIPFASDF